MTDHAVSWANCINTSNEFMYTAITTDNSGNLYGVGYVSGASGEIININGVDYVKPKSLLSNDIFGKKGAVVVKHDNNTGDIIWLKFIDGRQDDVGWSITTDSNNNVYVTGEAVFTTIGGAGLEIHYYDNIVNIGGSEYTVPFIPSIYDDRDDIPSNADKTVFIVKFTSDGDVSFVKWIGGDLPDSGKAITVDKDDNLYVTGYGTNNVIIDGSGYSSPNRGNNTTIPDIIIVKYNNLGVVQYVKWISGVNGQGHGITTDNDNNLYVTGYCNNANDSNRIITIDGSGYLKPNSWFGLLIVKYNNSGTLQWVRWIDPLGFSINYPTGIYSDAYNNIYISGELYGDNGGSTITINGQVYTLPGQFKPAFVSKYNTDGILQWIRWSGGESSGYTTIDNNNDIYMASSINGNSGNVIIIDGSGYVKPNNGSGICVIKYDNNGNKKWVKWIDGPGNDTIRYITSDYNNNLYITGTINGTSGETLIVDNSTYIRPRGGDITFISKFTPFTPSTPPELELPTSPPINFRLPIELDSSGHIATINAQGELVTYNGIDFAVEYDASSILSVSQLREAIYYKEDASNAAKVIVTISGEVVRGLLETGLQSSSLRSFWDDSLNGSAAIPLSSISGEGAKYFIDYDNVALNGSVSGTSMGNYLRRHVYNFIIGNLNGIGVSSSIGAAAVLGDIAISYNNTDATAIADKLVNKLVASDDNGAFIRQSIYEQMLNLDVGRFVGSLGDHATGVSGEGVDNEYRQLPFAVNDSLSFLVTFKFDNMQLGTSNNPFIITPTNPPTTNNYVSDSNKITVQDTDAMLPLAGPGDITAIFRVKFTQ